MASDAACKPELIVFNDVLVVYPGSLATLLTEYARVNSVDVLAALGRVRSLEEQLT